MSSADDYDYLLKVVMVGDSGVGKSCVLKRFASNEWQDGYISTIGVDFEIVTLNIDGSRVKLQIWDTAGQERFHNITTSYYRGAHCIMLVYDITSSQSFQNITQGAKWLEQIRMYASRECTVLLVGNKSDLSTQRSVQYDQANQLAQEHGLFLMECSAKDGVNVDTAFNWIGEKGLALRKAALSKQNKTLTLSPENDEDDQNCC